MAALPGKSSRLVSAAAVVALVAVVGFAVWYFGFHESEPRNDLERFQGDWRVTVAGRETPNVIRVQGDRWQSVANAIEGKAYRLSVNESASPKEIDLEPLDTAGIVGPLPRLRGVYVFENNRTARVRLEPGINPRPKTLDDPEAVIWVLNKVKLETPPTPK